MRILVLILVAASLAGCGGPAARYAAHEVPVDAGRAAAMISAYRVSRGLGPVAVDRRLNTVAAAQARSNAEIGELSHDAGGSFPVRLASFGAADRARGAVSCLSSGPPSSSSGPAAMSAAQAGRTHDCTGCAASLSLLRSRGRPHIETRPLIPRRLLERLCVLWISASKCDA